MKNDVAFDLSNNSCFFDSFNRLQLFKSKDFETPDQFYGLTQYDINEAKQNHNNATKI